MPASQLRCPSKGPSKGVPKGTAPKGLLRRARAPEHKSQRRDAIVRAAEGLLARREASDSCPVELLARKAGLAKGTVYLYFRSREEVLLAVHEKQTHEGFDVGEGSLGEPWAGGDSLGRTRVRMQHAHPPLSPSAGHGRNNPC